MILPRRPRPGRNYLAGAPLLVAHRGGARLAPENTLEAFRAAVELWGADMLEMDVRATRDGEIVVIHDPTVDRTTDGTGAVSSLDYAALAEMDAGARFVDLDGARSFRGVGIRVPRFEDVLRRFPGVRLNVEIKEPRAAEGLVALIERYDACERVLVAAEFERCRKAARGYRGPWGASRHHVLLFCVLHRFPGGTPYVPGADVLQVPEVWKSLRIVTPDFIRHAHRWNLPVQIWTVDDPDDMKRLLSWGVDGLQSDRPDLLACILTEECGRPPPPLEEWRWVTEEARPFDGYLPPGVGRA